MLNYSLYQESPPKKNCKSLDICPKQPYPTYLYPLVWTKFSLDINFSAYPTYLSNQFGHFGIRVCSWRRCQKHPDRGVPSFLWGYRAFSVSLGGVFTIYKSLRGVRDHFKNFQGRFWNFAYFYKYGHQYLTYLPQFFLSKLFFRKKVWLGNTLPTYGLDICPNFCSFFLEGSPQSFYRTKDRKNFDLQVQGLLCQRWTKIE